jgi:hypothetical protein
VVFCGFSGFLPSEESVLLSCLCHTNGVDFSLLKVILSADAGSMQCRVVVLFLSACNRPTLTRWLFVRCMTFWTCFTLCRCRLKPFFNTTSMIKAKLCANSSQSVGFRCL